jgi:hypothetical protein
VLIVSLKKTYNFLKYVEPCFRKYPILIQTKNFKVSPLKRLTFTIFILRSCTRVLSMEFQVPFGCNCAYLQPVYKIRLLLMVRSVHSSRLKFLLSIKLNRLMCLTCSTFVMRRGPFSNFSCGTCFPNQGINLPPVFMHPRHHQSPISHLLLTQLRRVNFFTPSFPSTLLYPRLCSHLRGGGPSVLSRQAQGFEIKVVCIPQKSRGKFVRKHAIKTLFDDETKLSV